MKIITVPSQLISIVLLTFSFCACAHKEEKREYLNSANNQPPAEIAPRYSDDEDLRKSAKFNTLSQNVKFETGSTQISKSARRALDEIAAEMQRASNSFEKVRISGYTDPRGPANANQNLALARANRVKGYLVSKGVPSEKLEALGKGVVQSDQMGAETQHQKDRKVDFDIVR